MLKSIKISHNHPKFWGKEGQIWIPHLPSPSFAYLFIFKKPPYPKLSPKVFFNFQKAELP